jgi:hyperosmotically inducible protein
MKKTLSLAVAIIAVGVMPVTQAQTPAPDNTRSNKVDPSNTTTTAGSQKNDSADMQITKQIRESIVADKSLSTYAHNVKIVSVSGNVTLNGVVRSQEEKDSIQSKAQAVVSSGSVTNNLKVAPPK